jgi:hypothetical protein
VSSVDLALIGNCQIAALLDRRGRFVWACVPRFDGDPTFCSLPFWYSMVGIINSATRLSREDAL